MSRSQIARSRMQQIEAEEIIRESVREILIQEGFLDDIAGGIATGVKKAYDTLTGLFKDKDSDEEKIRSSSEDSSGSNQRNFSFKSMLAGATGINFASNNSSDKLASAADVVNNPGSYGFNTGGSGGRWSLTPYERWCPPGSVRCRKMRPHYGVDLNRESNKDAAPIVAPLDGVVVNTGQDSTCGYKIKIRHGDKGYTRYCHLKEPPIVSEGESVVAGQRIGYVGSTGRSSGPHLHFETYSTGGSNINPLEWLSSNAIYFPITVG